MRNVSTPLTIALLCVAGVAVAAEPTACFGRTYDAAHLAAHPAQQIRDIRVRQIDSADATHVDYDLRVVFRDDPREFRVQPGCSDSDGQLHCVVDCDGGVVWPVHTADGGLRLTTDYLRAETGEHLPGEGGCTDPVTRSVADQVSDGHAVDSRNTRTVFVLHRRDRRECDWRDDDG